MTRRWHELQLQNFYSKIVLMVRNTNSDLWKASSSHSEIVLHTFRHSTLRFQEDLTRSLWSDEQLKPDKSIFQIQTCLQVTWLETCCLEGRYGKWLQSPRWLIPNVALPQRQANCTRISIYPHKIWTITTYSRFCYQKANGIPQFCILHTGAIFSYYRTYAAMRTKSIKGSEYSDVTELSDINTCEWITVWVRDTYLHILCWCTCGWTPLATGGTPGSRV